MENIIANMYFCLVSYNKFFGENESWREGEWWIWWVEKKVGNMEQMCRSFFKKGKRFSIFEKIVSQPLTDQTKENENLFNSKTT